MKTLSIKTRLIGSFALPVLAFAAVIVVVATGVRALRNQVALDCQQSMERALVAQQMKLDAVQVQQWLTDISATRALDGLADGFDEAAASRESFLAGLAQFRSWTTDDEARAQELESIGQAFDGYYKVGGKMARGYIDGGPEVGNQLMGEFDTQAQTLVGALDPFVQAEKDRLVAVVVDIRARADRMLVLMIATGAAAALLALVILWTSLRAIMRPLRAAVDFSSVVADGDLRATLPVMSNDELGALATSLNTMVRSLAGTVQGLATNAQALGSASQELSAVSTQVSYNSEETASQANVVASAAEQVSKNVTTVATAAEEMSASIKEVAQRAVEAARVAAQAMTIATQTNTTIAKLGESSNEIGKVIQVITSIAEQTNLLALNATIEAARAGDAGRGFAVVANEVKELARQTARATGDIRTRVEGIQGDTAGAVVAIKEIAEVITSINQIQTVIASSVEEQAATMNEISGNSTEASRGSAEIARNIVSVSEAARNSTQAAASTATAAGDLTGLAARLSGIVAQFRVADDTSPATRSDPETRPLVGLDERRRPTGAAAA